MPRPELLEGASLKGVAGMAMREKMRGGIRTARGCSEPAVEYFKMDLYSRKGEQE